MTLTEAELREFPEPTEAEAAAFTQSDATGENMDKGQQLEADIVRIEHTLQSIHAGTTTHARLVAESTQKRGELAQLRREPKTSPATAVREETQ